MGYTPTHITYAQGLYFNGGLAGNIDAQRSRIQKGKCSLIIVDGIPGEGKTTMAIHIAEYYLKDKIDYNCGYSMGFADFNKKFKICIKNGYVVIIFDEAGEYNKRGWASAINRHLNRIFEIYRTFKILIIMVLPSFHKIDSDLLLTGVPRLLVHCWGRTETYGRYKAYGLWRMTFIKSRMEDRRISCKHEVYRHVYPNTKGFFKNLEPERSKELDIISTQGKMDIFEDIEINAKGLLDFKKLAQCVNRSADWVRRVVSELGIKPEKVHKRKKYFSKEVIPEIMQLLDHSKDVTTTESEKVGFNAVP